MGLFSRLLGKQAPRAPVTALAMPFFGHAEPLDFRAALAWASRFPDAPAFGAIEGDAKAATVAIPGGQVALGHMPAPIPAPELSLVTLLAWHWPGVKAAVLEHRSHVIVHASSTELGPIDLHLLHSRVIAGLLATGKGSGVYVGGSRLLREGPEYVADMERATPESLPIMSWIGMNAVADGNKHSAYTAGLADFGLLELEVRDTKLQWTEVFGLLADVAHYEIAAGVQIRDGETLGANEADRKLVRHLDSAYFPGTKSAVITT